MTVVLFFTLVAALTLYVSEVRSGPSGLPQGGELHLPERSSAGYVSGRLGRGEFFGQLLPLLLVSVGLPLAGADGWTGAGLLAGAAVLRLMFSPVRERRA